MDDLEQRLRQLVADACRHPPGHAERQKNLTRIIRLVTPKLWRESSPYYHDALQQTWVYFCQNVCEGNTGKKFDPDRSRLDTWLNFYLRQRLKDGYLDSQKQRERTVAKQVQQSRSGETGDVIDPIDRLVAPPDIPPLLQQVREWAETDETGELRQIFIEGRPELNCQTLILRRLPPETSWKELAAEFGVAIPTLSSFYQRQCIPRLRKFGASEGYL